LLLGGRLAWLIWLLVHLGYLVGFENRVLVVIRFASRGHDREEVS
jgi:hypothetical protein